MGRQAKQVRQNEVCKRFGATYRHFGFLERQERPVFGPVRGGGVVRAGREVLGRLRDLGRALLGRARAVLPQYLDRPERERKVSNEWGVEVDGSGGPLTCPARSFDT